MNLPRMFRTHTARSYHGMPHIRRVQAATIAGAMGLGIVWASVREYRFPVANLSSNEFEAWNPFDPTLDHFFLVCKFFHVSIHHHVEGFDFSVTVDGSLYCESIDNPNYTNIDVVDAVLLFLCGHLPLPNQ